MTALRTASSYKPEIREWAVRVVVSEARGTGDQRAAIASVAGKVGCTDATLQRWVRQAELAGGIVPGLFTNPETRLKGLEREVVDLKRANQLLRRQILSLGGTPPDGPR